IFDILDYPQACINSDDLYLSFYLARKNIPRTNLWNNYISPKKIDWYNDISSAKDSLHKIEWPADKYRACLAFMQNKYPNIIL
ncbi:MAG: hypothetical protein K2X37_03220, partial [Chitinophagaceae bacterium]|nr:hypothetical protein [Chitinophagaceae bacterium]